MEDKPFQDERSKREVLMDWYDKLNTIEDCMYKMTTPDHDLDVESNILQSLSPVIKEIRAEIVKDQI